ncbi:MAG: hypothetical protein ACD_21C00156G0011 [uncultured bacterium]|nr:MAG: hypothetical protein ACD_21C00156G0011 [uncultured bacterium]
MNNKLLMFFAVAAFLLVGCNKEKEENISIPTTEQQQAVPTMTISDSVPTNNAPVVVDQGVVAEQQQAPVVSQVAPEAVVTPPSVDQNQPTQVIPAAPADQSSMTITQATQAPVTAAASEVQPAMPASDDMTVSTENVPAVQTDVAPVSPMSPSVAMPTHTQNDLSAPMMQQNLPTPVTQESVNSSGAQVSTVDSNMLTATDTTLSDED